MLLSLGKAEEESSASAPFRVNGWGSVLGVATVSTKGKNKDHTVASIAMNNNAAVLEVLNSLFDTELVVRKVAATAIRRLVEACHEWSIVSSPTGGGNSANGRGSDSYIMLIKTTILPILRKGLRVANDDAKSTTLELIAHVGRVFESSSRDWTPKASLRTCT